MVPEAPLERTDDGLVREGDGWFVVNACEARWRHVEGRSAICGFEDEPGFAQIGINYAGLPLREPTPYRAGWLPDLVA